jgi:hypothetical protein
VKRGMLLLLMAAPAWADVTITTTSLPDGTLGAPYSASLSLSGGRPFYRWVVSSGNLPPGLSLDQLAGTIRGIPGAAGTFNFRMRVTDAAGDSDTQPLSIAVRAAAPAPDPLAISTPALPAGIVGAPYSAALTAGGGVPPYSWSATGLPAGLTLSAGGQIGGTPSAAGQFALTVQVTDSAAATAAKEFAIAVSAAVAITTGGLPDGKAGSKYSASLEASGGTPPYTWSVASGSLPAGLTLNGPQITGTPASAGTASFAIRVADASGASASKAFSIAIAANAPPLEIASPNALPAGTAKAPYSYSLQARGGAPPYSWNVVSGSLPPGLALSEGTISGVPAADGTYSFTARVTDSAGSTASGTFSIAVAPGLSITSTSPLPAAAAGTAYSQALAALAGAPPYQWSIVSGALPEGLSLNPSTGVLSGTPAADGNFSFTVQVMDTAGVAVSKPFTMTVVSALAITTGSLASGSVAAPYTQTLAAVAGTSPYTWTVVEGVLPPGLALNSSAGAITGTPASTGTFNFTAQVRDSLGATATKALTITITRAINIANVSPLPPGTAGRPYSQQLSAQGGVAPYVWSVTAGVLPAGLALDSTGSIAGTPQAAGDFEFTFGVRDAAGGTASAAARLHIALDTLPAVAVTDLPDAAGPLAQPKVGVSIAGPYPLSLTGQLVLTFEPDATVPGDDPAIQFSTGGRTVDFSIPANSTQVSLPAPQIALQTGSVAGTITVTAVLKAGGVDATPSPVPLRSLKVARSAPVIRSLKMVKTAAGFEIWITGYSPSRDLTQAAFRFTPAQGSDLRTSTANLPLSDSARQWYQDAASKLFGSQFTIVQPFTVQGSSTAIGAVSVTLTNSAGTSEEVAVPAN